MGGGVDKKAKKRTEKAKNGLKIAIFGTFSCEGGGMVVIKYK